MMPVRSSPHDEQPESRLARLPQELLDRVTRELPTVDLGSLRLSCKLIERRLFPGFAKEFFSKKQYMLTAFSIQTLLDISRHPDIAPYVTELQIGTDRYFSQPPRLNPEEKALFQEGVTSQVAFVSGGYDREMLQEAMSLLPNLSRIVIRDNNSRGRKRDVLQTTPWARIGVRPRPPSCGEWRSYGACSVDRFTEMSIPHYVLHAPAHGMTVGSHSQIMSISRPAYITRIWLAVLTAIPNCASKPKHIELLLRAPGSSLPVDSMGIPAFLQPKVTPALAALEVLHLRVFFASEDSNKSNLQKLLCLTPNLKHLRINADIHGGYPNSDQIEADKDGAKYLLRWLARSDDLPAGFEPAPIEWPNLERLELGSMRCVEADDVIRLAKGLSSTLQGLNFHRISLISPAREKKSVWPPVLRAIGRMQRLRSLDLFQLTQFDTTANSWYPVIVNPSASSGRTKARYSGQLVGSFCDDIIKVLTVEFPQWADSDQTDESEPDADSESDGNSDPNPDEEDEEDEEEEDAGGDGQTGPMGPVPLATGTTFV